MQPFDWLMDLYETDEPLVIWALYTIILVSGGILLYIALTMVG